MFTYNGNSDGSAKLGILYVRPESVEAYKADTTWTNAFEQILPYEGFGPSAIEETLVGKAIAPQLTNDGISGLTAGETVTVFNLTGIQLCRQTVPANGCIAFDNQAGNIYIVHCGNQVYKIIR